MAISIQNWIKPGIIGGIIGAIAITIIGFSTNSIVSQGTAEEMAQNAGNKAMIAALAPICVAQFKSEPQQTRTTQLAALADASSYERDDFVAKQGWATMPGSQKPNNEIADACAEQLMKLAKTEN